MTKGLTVHELAESRDAQIARLKQLEEERQSAGPAEGAALDEMIRAVNDEIHALDTLLKAAMQTEN